MASSNLFLSELFRHRKSLEIKISENKNSILSLTEYIDDFIDFLQKHHCNDYSSYIFEYKNVSDESSIEKGIIEIIKIIYDIETKENMRVIERNSGLFHIKAYEIYQEAYDINLFNLSLSQENSFYYSFRVKESFEASKAIYIIVKTFVDDRNIIEKLDNLYLDMLKYYSTDPTLQIAKFVDYMASIIDLLDKADSNNRPSEGYNKYVPIIVGIVVLLIMSYMIYCFMVSRSNNTIANLNAHKSRKV